MMLYGPNGGYAAVAGSARESRLRPNERKIFERILIAMNFETITERYDS